MFDFQSGSKCSPSTSGSFKTASADSITSSTDLLPDQGYDEAAILFTGTLTLLKSHIRSPIRFFPSRQK